MSSSRMSSKARSCPAVCSHLVAKTAIAIQNKIVAAIAMVESGVGRNERRTFTQRRKSRTEKGVVYKFKRTPSQFCGELQMGNLAGQDVGFEKIPIYRKGPDGKGYRVSWDTTRALLGNTELAYEKFFEYMRRYEARHGWEGGKMAVLWKAGPGSMSRINEVIDDEGLGLDAAVAEAHANHGVLDAREYLRRYRRDYARVDKYAQGKQGEKMRDAFARAILWPVTQLGRWFS